MEILADATTTRIAHMRKTFAQLTGRENAPVDDTEATFYADDDFDGPDEPMYSESDLDYFADVAEDRETRWREGI